MTLARRGWICGAAALVGGAGLGWWAHSGAAAGEALGPAFWTQRFERPEGGQLDFAALRGKPLLVNFWATWCPPCIEELPLIDRFFQSQSPKGWQVVGLAIDQPTPVRKFLQRTPVGFPIGLAGMQGTELVKHLGNTRGGLPFTLVIGRDGNVAARKMGQVDQALLDAWIQAQLRG